MYDALNNDETGNHVTTTYSTTLRPFSQQHKPIDQFFIFHTLQGYVAPEILTGTPYDESADMWSVGVILYILLGGYPPFLEDDQRRLFRKIRKGQYEFHEEYWGTVSEDAKNLISNLLVVNAENRLTAREALQSVWISQASDAELGAIDMGSNLHQLRKFNGKRKFRAAVASVIAANKLQNFLAFDTFQPGCAVNW